MNLNNLKIKLKEVWEKVNEKVIDRQRKYQKELRNLRRQEKELDNEH